MNIVYQFFKLVPDTAMAQNIKRWIKEDLNASLNDVTDFDAHMDTARLFKDKNGIKPKY